MKNSNKLIVALLLLGLGSKNSFAMENPNGTNNQNKKSFWEKLQSANSTIKKYFIFSPLEIIIGKQKDQNTIHPDIEKFLRKEMAQQTSLTKEQLEKLEFKMSPNSFINDLHFLKANQLKQLFFGIKPSMQVPNLETFFIAEETDDALQFIEIPTNQLSKNLKEAKDLIHVFLKHEEGHYYHQDSLPFNPFVPIACLFLPYSWKNKTMLACGLAGVRWGLLYRNELLADQYAINHINDPAKLKRAGLFFESLDEFQKRNGRIQPLYDHHPSLKSRADRFLAAAEVLEKKVKDRE